MSVAKIIKRYANRKLYDSQRSCYVTLNDIAAMIKNNEELRVIDNRSGEDLTSVTLAQILFETEKKARFMPLAVLRQLIQEGSDALLDFAGDTLGLGQKKSQATTTKTNSSFDSAQVAQAKSAEDNDVETKL